MTEKHRHECEVRHLLSLRIESKDRSDGYLEKVEASRGKAAAVKLKRDAAQLWEKERSNGRTQDGSDLP